MTDNRFLAGPPSLVEQRRRLRQHLQSQRRQLAVLLVPAQAFPRYQLRSRTMRFLTQQPVATAALLAVLATVLFGTHLRRSMPIALAFTRMLSTASGQATHRDATAAPAHHDESDNSPDALRTP